MSIRFIALIAVVISLFSFASGFMLRSYAGGIYQAIRPVADSNIVQIADFSARYFDGQDVLVVDLHQWSADHRGSFGNDFGLDEAVRNRGWADVRPHLGSNASPEGCCSQQAMDRLQAAISFAKERSEVERVYIVGASGGGYSGLCALMNGIEADAYNLWVPISDLSTWLRQSRATRYADDILACTGGDPDEMRRRSPLQMSMPENLSPLRIYTGINDGWHGTVPVTQSINMFNRLANETGHASSAIDIGTILHILELREAPEPFDARLTDDTDVHLHAVAGSTELIVFEGAHQGLSAQVLADIDRQ